MSPSPKSRDDSPSSTLSARLNPMAERLRQVEARYRALSIASGQITWTTNREGLVVEDLPDWRAFTGQTYEQTLGVGWRAAVHPEDLPALQLVWQSALAAQASYTNIMRVRRFDGMYRTVQERGEPVLGGDGMRCEWVGMCEDITDQRQREQEMTQRARQLAAILAAIPERISIFDEHGTMVQMNPAGQAHAGPQRGQEQLTEFPQVYDLRTVDGEPLAVADLPLAQALRGEAVHDVELLMRGADGQDELLQTSAAPLYDEQGQLAGAVAITRDISAQRQTELAIANQAHETAAILEAITDAVYVYDAAGKLTRTNRATQTMNAQITDAEYRDRTFEQRLTDVVILTPEGQPLAQADLPIARVLQGEILDGANAVDTQIRNPEDDRVLLLNTTGAPIRDSQGAIIGGVIVARDVAERRRLERHTQDALQALLAMAHALVLPEQQDGTSTALTMARLAELARRVLGSERVALVSYDAATDMEEPLAIAGVTPAQEAEWRAALAQAHLRDFLAPRHLAQLRAGESFLLDLTTPHLEQAGMGGEIALITPMHIGDQLVGTLSLDFGRTPHAYQPEDFELARAVASLAALVIERERLIRARAEAQSEALALAETNRRMDEFLSIAAMNCAPPLPSSWHMCSC